MAAAFGESVLKRARCEVREVDTLLPRQELALCYRVCEKFGLNEGVCNHLSIALPDNDTFLLIAYGVPWSQATASDILVLNHGGRVLLGTGEPERSGFVSHRALHSLGTGATAVLHTHMPFATALCSLKPECGGRLLPLHQNILKFRGWVVYDDDWGGLFDDDESDRTTREALKFKEETGRCPRAMLSANHGVFAFGSSIAEAWDNLYYLERLCEVQVRALSAAGGDVSKLRLIEWKKVDAHIDLAESDRPKSIAEHWRAMDGMMKNVLPIYRF